MREELSDRFAKSVVPTKRNERYFDQDKRSPRGFLLRVTPAGARVWALRYRVPSTGREREVTIGDVKSWPISAARRRGHELRRDIDAGADPLAEREEGRAAPAVADLVRRFEEEGPLARRAPRTQAEYRAMLRSWILPAIGRKKVAAVTRDDIEKLHQKITGEGKLRRANSVKSLCSTLFRQAIIWKMREDNPASRITSNPEHGRERYLSEEEVARLVAVLTLWREKKPNHVDSVDAITLAMLTGARRGEVLTMRWTDLDLVEGVWKKPPGLTKQRKAHRTPLSGDAVALLQRRQSERQAAGKVVQLRDEGGPVFRGGGGKTHRNTLERDWCIIRAAAGLEDVRFHDLRHSFASQLVGAGISLPIIGAMLGHSRVQTTQRYAHLSDAPLRAAAEIVAGNIGRKS